MMKSNEYCSPPFRAEHIGSLLRSKDLLDLWYNDPRDEQERLVDMKKLENAEIKEAVRMQQAIGLRGITDGEIRRRLHWGSFFTDLEGFEEVILKDLNIFRPYVGVTKLFTEAGETGASAVICTGKIKHVRSSFLEDFEYLKSLVGQDRVKEIKVTISSLELHHLIYRQGCAYPESVYASDEEYFSDLAEAFRREVKILYDAGMRNLQIDDPNLAYFCDQEVHKGWAQDEKNTRTSDQQIEMYINLINDSIRDLPDDCRVSLHLCKGNFKSGYWASGGYDLIATKLFTICKVSTYLLEFDTERSGCFEPLKVLPKDKHIVLGLITTKNGVQEDLHVLEHRVKEAARCIAEGSNRPEEETVRQLSVSPQCGFASANVGNNITKEEMALKLRLVRKLADTIWPGEP